MPGQNRIINANTCLFEHIMMEVMATEFTETHGKKITPARNFSVSFRGFRGYTEILAPGLRCQHRFFPIKKY